MQLAAISPKELERWNQCGPVTAKNIAEAALSAWSRHDPAAQPAATPTNLPPQENLQAQADEQATRLRASAQLGRSPTRPRARTHLALGRTRNPVTRRDRPKTRSHRRTRPRTRSLAASHPHQHRGTPRPDRSDRTRLASRTQLRAATPAHPPPPRAASPRQDHPDPTRSRTRPHTRTRAPNPTRPHTNPLRATQQHPRDQNPPPRRPTHQEHPRRPPPPPRAHHRNRRHHKRHPPPPQTPNCDTHSSPTSPTHTPKEPTA